jgi:hypothetical protein
MFPNSILHASVVEPSGTNPPPDACLSEIACDFGHIDGNYWSSRFGKLLCYISVIVKLEPKHVDYCQLKYLEPWKQYIQCNTIFPISWKRHL